MTIDWKQPKNLKIILLAAAAAAVFLAIGILLRAPEPLPPSPDPETPIAQLEERVMPSALRRHGEFLAQLALQQTTSLAYSAELEATVVVWDREGWAVAPAARVPAERQTQLLRHDGTLWTAEIQAADPWHNLYLLRLTSPRPGVPVVPEDNPGALRPGVRLFAVGLNPQGQLSLLNGELSEPVAPQDATLAFTGPLARGSLGSILVTLDETVVGLLARQGQQPRVWNWRFVAEIAADLRQQGFHAHPDLGVAVDDDSGLREQPPDAPGVVIQSVLGASPAAEKGVRPGDRLTRINERPVRTRGEFTATVKQLSIGSRARLTLRSEGEERTIEIEVAGREELRRQAAGAKHLGRWGLHLVPLPAGLRVVEVEPWSPAARARLRVGDHLLGADGRRFTTAAALERYLNRRQSPVRLEILRQDHKQILRLPLLEPSASDAD